MSETTVMPFLNPAYASTLPVPIRSESFSLLKRGVWDDSSVDVYLNATSDFALLAPPPVVDYSSYKPRHQSLRLTGYKKARHVIESRYSKIASCFNGATSVLEFGAAEGAFLAHLAAVRPDLALAAIEPDDSTRPQRDAITGLLQFATLEASADAGFTVDVMCLFHVFEHLADPASFLSSAKRLLVPGGRIIIEVPSLDDPLLSLYKSAAYRAYQRYGMENHLAWLSTGRPGGNAEFSSIFDGCETAYKAALEARGLTDTVFAIARAAP